MELEKQCRLCSNAIDDTFQVIEGNTREIFEYILSNLSLHEGTEEVLCNKCFVKLFKVYNFKAVCLETEDSISPYMDSKEPMVQDLKEIYKMEKGYANINDELDQKVCRLCMNLVTFQFMRLRDVDEVLIQGLIPEVNFNSTKDPVICNACFQSLWTFNNFLIIWCNSDRFKEVGDSCIKTEEVDIKIEENETDSKSGIKEIENVCERDTEVQPLEQNPAYATEVGLKANAEAAT